MPAILIETKLAIDQGQKQTTNVQLRLYGIADNTGIICMTMSRISRFQL